MTGLIPVKGPKATRQYVKSLTACFLHVARNFSCRNSAGSLHYPGGKGSSDFDANFIHQSGYWPLSGCLMGLFLCVQILQCGLAPLVY